MTNRIHGKGVGCQVSGVRLALRLALLSLVSLLSTQSMFAQVATGVPPLSSNSASTFDTVNNADLNISFAVPIVEKPGRGLPLRFPYSYSGSIWIPVTSGSTILWTPISTNIWGWNSYPTGAGGVSFQSQIKSCIGGGGKEIWNQYYGFIFTDQYGTKHPFNITISDWSLQGDDCGSGAPPTTGSGTATDASGFTLSVQATLNYHPVNLTSLKDSSGNSYGASITGFTGTIPGTGTVGDPNGNQLTTNGSGNYYDTLSTTTPALVLSGSGTPASPLLYKYYGPDGNQYTYTAKFTQYTIQTNFGCSGVTEYGATTQNLVSEIDQPDGSKYTFTYETTPSHSPNVTGRLASVELPTGGTIYYTYTGGSNGITCTDGSVATLQRKTPDTGSNYWQYAHTESGTAWTTTVTDPQSNVTTYHFQQISGTLEVYETERQIKQGSTVLEDISTYYNGNTSNCNTTAITAQITQSTAVATMGSLQSKVNTTYNSAGLPTEVDEYAYGSGAPGSLVRKTVMVYNSFGEPTDVQIQDSGSNVKSHTAYSYNSTGNKTGETRYTGGTPSTINHSFTPNSYGVLTASTDFNSNSTSYSSFTCGDSTAFPQTTTFPDTTSTSTAWNCYLALATSISDVNGNATGNSYDTMVRPSGTSYPDGGGMTTTYTSPTAQDIYTNIVGSTQRHDQIDLDGLSRVVTNATVNDPDGETYVAMAYDALGRKASVSRTFAARSFSGRDEACAAR